MAQQNVSGWAEGLTNLGQIFAPNAGRHIQADLALGKRELYSAQADAQAAAANASYANAAATRNGINIANNADARLGEMHDNLMGLGGALTGLDPSTPEGRAGIIGAFGSAGVDLNDPSTIAGYTTLIDPNFAGDPQNLANVFVGTGAVDSFDQTQPGQAQAEEAARQQAVQVQEAANIGSVATTAQQGSNALELADTNNGATMDQLEFYRDNPAVTFPGQSGRATQKVLTVGTMDEKRAADNIAALISEMTGGEAEPSAVQGVTATASQLYSQPGSPHYGQWPSAIQAAMEQFKSDMDAQSVGSAGNGASSGLAQFLGELMTPGSTMLADPLGMLGGGGQPPAAQAPAAQTAQPPQFSVGQTATGQNGEKIRFNGTGWERVQ